MSLHKKRVVVTLTADTDAMPNYRTGDADFWLASLATDVARLIQHPLSRYAIHPSMSYEVAVDTEDKR